MGKQWGGVGIGHLDTADPLNPEVQKWWMDKVNEIYSLIPDFGGFLVKANSEGMAGPQDYHRSLVDGANMLARALKPHGGIVLWRTFVYNPEIDKDRMKRSYKEFQPLDGQFDENVVLQTKNGTLDFQPSEPAQPLFGAMRHTPAMPSIRDGNVFPAIIFDTVLPFPLQYVSKSRKVFLHMGNRYTKLTERPKYSCVIWSSGNKGVWRMAPNNG